MATAVLLYLLFVFLVYFSLVAADGVFSWVGIGGFVLFI